MISQLPNELKLIRPYIHRGNQMEKVDPVITYYCYYWAVRLSLEKGLHTKSPECTAFVSTLMEDLEGRKEALKGDDRLDDDMAARAYVENFAFKVFDNGSRAVDTGRATEKTPDTLQAAVVFLELTKIFADDPEVAKKIKYAKFHAARILKALKEGTDPNPLTPEPGQPPPRPTLEEVPDESFGLAPQLTGDTLHNEPDRPAQTPHTMWAPSPPLQSLSLHQPPPLPSEEPVSPPDLPSTPSHMGYSPPVPEVHEPSTPGLAPVTMGSASTVFPDIGNEHTYRPPSPPSLPSAPPFQPTHAAPSPLMRHYQQPLNTHIPPPMAQRKEVRQEDIVQAQKYAKWAISALDYEDIDNAILQFRSALATLGAAP